MTVSIRGENTVHKHDFQDSQCSDKLSQAHKSKHVLLINKTPVIYPSQYIIYIKVLSQGNSDFIVSENLTLHFHLVKHFTHAQLSEIDRPLKV